MSFYAKIFYNKTIYAKYSQIKAKSINYQIRIYIQFK